MRVLSLVLVFLLGFVAGIAAIAVHRSPAGLVLGVAAALLTIRTVAAWVPRASTAFAVGWLVPLVFAVAGRAEGDVAVASDAYGWLLIASGLVVLVTGVVRGRAHAVQNGANPRGAPT